MMLEAPSDRADRSIVALLSSGLIGLLGIVAGLIAGLAGGGMTAFLIKLLSNHPLPPWGWRTNIVIETIADAGVCLAICHLRRTEPWARLTVVLVAAAVIGLAFVGNGPVVLTLLNLTYFLPPCVVGVASALVCMRSLWAVTTRTDASYR